MLAADKLKLRLVAPASVAWPGVSSPIGPSAAVLSKTLYARPLPSSQVHSSPDLVQGSYTTRLDDAGEQQFTFPNVVNSQGSLWRDVFDPSGHLRFLEIWLDGELEQVVCIDTSQVSDGRGFSATLDATDFVSSLWGNGAGLQNGTSGQLQAVVYDPATLAASLFDAQGWQDFSDASFVSLLQGLLNSALGLRLMPWQLLSNDPSGGGEGSVQVHGQDGWWLLKKAYERDWVVVQSPRDVFERATQVWVPVTSDDFPGVGVIRSFTDLLWTPSSSNGGSVQRAAQNGVIFTAPANNPAATASITAGAIAVGTTAVWRALVDVQVVALPTGSTLGLEVDEPGVNNGYSLTLAGGFAYLSASANVSQTQVAAATHYTLLIESDGTWVWGYVNGQLVGCVARNGTAATTSLTMTIGLVGALSGSTAQVAIKSTFTETLQPFLQRGSDKGDYVLPGSASTYPSGGLHARYYNDTDLQADTNRLVKILAPSRSQAYAGSGTAEYQNQQDATINFTAPFAPTPGAAATNYSVKWFGAIWLELSKGDYGIAFTVDDGVRIWIGKTKWGDQIIDSWITQSVTTHSATLAAASLAGNSGYGGAPVARDGWYPIVIEYFQDGGGANAQFLFTPPASYTDPGGTALAGGAQVIVPATSLSPLGCVDQRYQGISHFDLAQQTVQAFGYQASVEPQQLESGLFPGVLAPRVREGHDTDLILAPPTGPRTDWAGPLRPQQASTWPLPGNLAAMRWRPGDAIRAQDKEIGVWDTAPRQILTFTRNLLPNGIASAVASLANRPRNAARALKQQLYQATRWQRNYQRQLVTLPGGFISGVIGAGATGANSVVLTLATDAVVRIYLRVSINSGPVAFNVLINAADKTSALTGAATVTTVPLNLPLGAVAAPDANGQIYAALKVPGGVGSTFNYQLFVDVLR